MQMKLREGQRLSKRKADKNMSERKPLCPRSAHKAQSKLKTSEDRLEWRVCQVARLLWFFPPGQLNPNLDRST